MYNHHRFKGVHTQNASYIFKVLLRGGLGHVSLQSILKTLPTKTTPGGSSAINFTFQWGFQKMYLTMLVWSLPKK